jgi:PST family polysaccharide transporter
MIGAAGDGETPQSAFEAKSPPNGQRRLAINAAAGGAANMAKIAIQVIMIPLMARLLGPAEFGLFALAIPTISLLMSLADGGLGASMARESEDATEIWSSAFWVLLCIGVALVVFVSGWGVILAAMSHEPRLRGLMVFLSISFLLIVVTVLPSARLVGQRRLFIISGGDLLSTIVGAAAAIALALSGAGVWSLAGQFVAGAAVRAIIFNLAAFVKPTLAFDLPSLRSHISTGSSLMGTRLSDFGGRLVENLMYERIFGAGLLGNYTFANQAPRFICEAFSGPMWAALYAHALHEDPDEVRALHVKLTHLLSLLVFPAAFILAGTATEVLDLVLGNQWEYASELLRILVPFYALSVVAGQSGAIMLASNRGWLSFSIVFGGALARIVAVALGPWIGQTGVAWGISATLAGTAVAFFFSPLNSKGGNGPPLVHAAGMPFLCAAAAGLVSFETVRHLPGGVVPLIASFATGGICYCILIAGLEGKHLRSQVAAIWRGMRFAQIVRT